MSLSLRTTAIFTYTSTILRQNHILNCYLVIKHCKNRIFLVLYIQIKQFALCITYKKHKAILLILTDKFQKIEKNIFFQKNVLQFMKKYVIITTQSVMLSLCTEVVQMKYENPTCDIVVLDRADCLTASPWKDDDSPMAPVSVF